jgi:adenylate cyclase
MLQDEADVIERRAVVSHVRHDRTVPKIIDWQRLLVDGYEPMMKAQKVFRRLPSNPRCKLCQNPFGGVAGRVLSHMGRRPSRKNPNLCQYCFDHLPPGGLELDIGVVFADVRGSTALGERSTATEFAEKLNRFYATATDVFVRHDGLIDKLIGDEVMALFIPGLAGADYRTKAARAAIELAGEVVDPPIGIAAHAGIAFVGNVGSGTVLDFTALGDAVNTAARLQSEAAPGEVVLLSDLYDLVADSHPGAIRKRVDVRGREEPVDIAVLACGRFAS